MTTRSRGVHSKEFSMAAQTFRHAAQLSASRHRLLDRILAMLALLYNAALEERIQAYCRSG